MQRWLPGLGAARQGTTWTVVAEARQLFPSLLSAIAFQSSAQANTWYVPAGVPPGIVTVTVPQDWLPAVTCHTQREGVSGTSPAPFPVS